MLLIGGGTVNLSGTYGYMFGVSSGASEYRLINVDNVIRGHGELVVPEIGFTNRHIVQADAPGGQNPDLRFFNHGQVLINSGVMQATGGGRLRLSGGGASQATAMMENFEGTDAGEIIAGENSTVVSVLFTSRAACCVPRATIRQRAERSSPIRSSYSKT